MMPKRKTGIPSDAAYRAGKKKANVTKAIRALEMVQADIRDSVFNRANLLGASQGITELLPCLKSYRKMLDTI